MQTRRTAGLLVLSALLAGVMLAGVTVDGGAGATQAAAAPFGQVTSVGRATAAAPTVTLPPVNGQFDYQIGGVYTPAESVAIVSRDREADAAAGKYNICYINAFQTQPGEAAFWKKKHKTLLLKNSKGKYITDPDWPGEYILDTSTTAKRKSIATLFGRWMSGCKAAGFQAIEPDNLDSWTRSGKKLTQSKNLALAKLLATKAHSLGLAIAQKNTADIGSKGKKSVKFDFAIAEECQVYKECGAYTGPYGDNVIEIEYTDNKRSAYTAACAAQGASISVILRDRDVVPSSESAYRYEYC